MDELQNAVRAGDIETIRDVLTRRPDLVNAAGDLEARLRPSDTRGMRPIHHAIAGNQPEAVRLLIEYGADLNARNADGRLPLHDCFELGRDELARVLLAAGAEADVCAAAAYGMQERLHEILRHDPAQANDLQTGLTPIAWSIYGDREDAARLLLAHGAIVNRPPYDRIAWQTAAHVANVKLARVLLEHDADPNCRDEHGGTPVHAAIRSRIVVDPAGFVELLLGAGANAAAVNHDGRTALDEALLQLGRVAETYFPAAPLAPKRLDRVIELLRKPPSSMLHTEPRA